MTPEPNYIFYYILSGLFGTALCFIIWNYFKKLDKVVSMLSEQIATVKLDQEILKTEMRFNKQHVQRLEDSLADDIVEKLRAITPR